MTDDIIPLEEARRRKTKKTTAAPMKSVKQNDEAGSSQRDKLIACAADAELWHDADGTGYATLAVEARAVHRSLPVQPRHRGQHDCHGRPGC